MVSAQEKDWLNVFQRLQEHIAAGGRLTLDPQTEEERSLMVWVAANMRAHALGSLSLRHERLLRTIPGWTWTLTEPVERAETEVDDWSETAGHLEGFVARTDRLPFRSRRHENWLWEWMTEQQKAYPDQLTDAQASRLTQLPGWRWTPASPAVGAARYARFVAAQGRLPRRYALTFEGELAVWAREIRRKHAAGKLIDEETTAVEQIPGWSWTASDAGEERDDDDED